MVRFWLAQERYFPVGKVPPFHEKDTPLIPVVEKISDLINASGFFPKEDNTAVMTPFCWATRNWISLAQ